MEGKQCDHPSKRYGFVMAVGCALLGGCVSVAAQDAALPKRTSPTHELSPHFLGVNIENSYMASPVLSWTDPLLLRAIKAVGIQAVRFPGGDVSNYWDWQNGTVYPIGKAGKTNDSLQALSALVRATGVYPIYSVNVMTLSNAVLHRSQLPQAIDNQVHMLDAIRDLRLPVEEVELGNEFYWSSPDHDRAFPAGADYAADMNAWTAGLKKAYPHLRVASMAAIPSSGDARTKHWNEAVVGKTQGIDAVTLHRYDNIVDGGVWDGTEPDAVLGRAFTDWASIVAGQVRMIEKARSRVWVTEFGGFQDCTSHARFSGTWLEALYQSQMLVQFLSTPSVDQVDLYNMAGSTGSLMFQPSSSYWNACQSKSMVFHATVGDLTATGQAYSLFGGALKQAKSAYAVTFAQAPMIHPKSGASYPAVTGVALQGQGNQWLLLNLSSQPVTLRYPGMGRGHMESLSAPALTTVVTSEHVLKRGTEAFDGQHFVLPAYSVNRVVVER